MGVATVAAEQTFGREILQYWVPKIVNGTEQQLRSYLRELGPRETAACTERVVIRGRGAWTYREGKIIGASEVAGFESKLNLDSLGNLLIKMRGQSGDLLDLLRLTIMLTIVNQLKRQLEGLS